MINIIQKFFFKLGYNLSKRNYKKEKDTHFGNFSNPSYIKKLLLNKDNPTIFDIGAFDGRTSLSYIKSFPNAKIYAFEPFPTSFISLKKNVKNFPNIKTENFAVSDKVGEASFYCNNFDQTNSLYESSDLIESFNVILETKEKITVKTTTLDDYFKSNNLKFIDILKLDIQGGELDALKGAEKLLNEKKIKLIYSEIELVELYKNQPLFLEVSNYLDSKGYLIYGIYNLNFDERGRILWCDIIYIEKGFSLQLSK